MSPNFQSLYIWVLVWISKFLLPLFSKKCGLHLRYRQFGIGVFFPLSDLFSGSIPFSLLAASALGNYQVLLRPIKNILFISHIKKGDDDGKRKQSKRRRVETGPSKSHNQNLFGNVCALCALRLDATRLDSRETFYAHLSHFQQFRLKNSSKQFMAGRKNQIKIHAQQRDSKTATFSIQRHHQRISTPKKRE